MEFITDYWQTIKDVLKVNTINGSAILFINMNQVKDAISIILGIVSIVSTLIIIRNNTQKKDK